MTATTPLTLDDVRTQAMQLSDGDRIELANELLDSVKDTDEFPFENDPDFIAELDRRVQAHLDGTSPGIPGDVFLRRLRGQT